MPLPPPEPETLNLYQFPLHRLFEFIDLTPAECHALERLQGPAFHVERGHVIRQQGEPADHVFLLVSGWAIASVAVPSGDRQIVKVHLPGDMLGSPSMVLTRAAETLTAVTRATVTRIPLRAVGSLFTDAPRLAAALFMSVQQERIMLMDRITSVGRTRAERRIAAFLLHIYDRLRVIDPEQAPAFNLPLTQEQIGDALGLTSVHVNRTFREFQDTGLFRRSGQDFVLLDVDRMRRKAAVPQREWVRHPEWFPQASKATSESGG